MALLDREYEFYKKNKESLLPKYENKFIAIVGHEVVAAYDNEIEAVETTMKKHKLGTFLVQKVTKKDEVYHFHSPIFSKKSKSA